MQDYSTYNTNEKSFYSFLNPANNTKKCRCNLRIRTFSALKIFNLDLISKRIISGPSRINDSFHLHSLTGHNESTVNSLNSDQNISIQHYDEKLSAQQPLI